MRVVLKFYQRKEKSFFAANWTIIYLLHNPIIVQNLLVITKLHRPSQLFRFTYNRYQNLY